MKCLLIVAVCFDDQPPEKSIEIHRELEIPFVPPVGFCFWLDDGEDYYVTSVAWDVPEGRLHVLLGEVVLESINREAILQEEFFRHGWYRLGKEQLTAAAQ